MTYTTKKYVLLAAFVAVTLGIGLAIGLIVQPGGWYASLNKPPFNPPNWVFGPVWTTLYVMIAVAGWRTFMRSPRSAAMTTWGAQLALNFLWTPVFFGLHQTGIALLIIAALLASVVVFIIQSWRPDRVSAWLFAPYAAWVGFATILNGSIWFLN